MRLEMLNVLTTESIFVKLLHNNLINNENFFAIPQLYAFRYPEGTGNMARIVFCWEGLQAVDYYK